MAHQIIMVAGRSQWPGRRKHAAAHPLLFILFATLLLSGVACSPADTGEQAATPTNTPVVLPTTEVPAAVMPSPTAVTLPTAVDTAIPTVTDTAQPTATPPPTATDTEQPPPTFVTATQAPTLTALPTEIPLACNDVIEAAILRIDDICAGTARNEACYGHDQVTVVWQPGASGQFSQPSHRARLANLRRLNTGPYDPVNADDPTDDRWGIALLRVQADLPDALPGQAITFLAYGDATIEADESAAGSGPMQAVTIQTGFSSPVCADAPDPGVLIQNDTGEVASLTVNGVDILVGSTVLVQAEAGQAMTLGVLEGRVDALALGERVSAAAGMQIRVGLDANLRASRVPRLEQLDLSRIADGRLQPLLDRLPKRVTLPQVLNIFPQLEPLIPRRPGLLLTRRAPQPTATAIPVQPTSPPLIVLPTATLVPVQQPTFTPVPQRATDTPIPQRATFTPVDSTTGGGQTTTKPTATPTLFIRQIVTVPPLIVLPTATPTFYIMQQAPLVVTLPPLIVLPTATPVPIR